MGLDLFFIKKKKIGYFRKINFLVSFFELWFGKPVENLQEIEIDKLDIEELLRRCNIVLEDHSEAENMLPTHEGFFFGNTEYDEEYFNDVKKVKEYIENTLLPEIDELKDTESISFKIWY